jgi:hypothetical protein
MAGIIEHRKFIAVEANADANHNKAWTYTVYDDNTVKYEWGRVADPMPHRPNLSCAQFSPSLST